MERVAHFEPARSVASQFGALGFLVGAYPPTNLYRLAEDPKQE